jgi:hypothetical protein
MKRKPTANRRLAKVAVQCSADTFVVNQNLVLRINICGKNRHLLVAAKRYASPYDDRQCKHLTQLMNNNNHFRKQI